MVAGTTRYLYYYQCQSMRSMQGRKVLSISEVGVKKVADYVSRITDSSVVTPVMVHEEDVKRCGDCC